jgi:hypothetical protein
MDAFEGRVRRMRYKRQISQQAPVLFLAIITMAALAVFIQLDRMVNKNGTRDMRAKAYQQTATGVRIEGEEMSLSGAVSKSSSGTYIQF